MDDEMKNEDEKWFDQLLKTKPQITDDDFSTQVMAKIDHYHSRKQKNRRNILMATYLISSILASAIMPWSWLAARFRETLTLFSGLIDPGVGTQFPAMSLSILFVISFTIYVFSQETN